MNLHVLWHMEFQQDYSQFPKMDWGEVEGIVPTVFDQVPAQCRSFEEWRKLQEDEYLLHIYMSHFSAFIPPTIDSEFFDFHQNILYRRHQAFRDWQNEDVVLLFSPGILIAPDFDIKQYIDESINTQQLINVSAADCDGILSGIWVIPQSVLKVFAADLPTAVCEKCAGDDLAYWQFLANSIGVKSYSDCNITNYLPQYTKTDVVISDSDITSSCKDISYDAWSKEQFATWMNSQQFKFAKTMRWCPHEYILLMPRPFEEQLEYLMVIDYLHRNAHVNVWKTKYQFATICDGHLYWYVGVIDLLNRTSKELERRIFAEDGKDVYGRPLKTKLF